MTAWRCCIGRISRKEFINSYRTRIMRQDGSTIYGRFDQPRVLVQLPIDLRIADEVERRIRMADRKSKPKVSQDLEFNDDFDFTKYARAGKKSEK